MAGSAMLMVESSDTTKTPAAAIRLTLTRVFCHAARAALAMRRASAIQSRAMNITPGTTHEVSWTVTPERTANAMGNTGVMVFATPWVIALLENAAHGMIKAHLPPGASTVGTMVEMKHLAATPIGMTVRAKATLLSSDGRRYLFTVEAWDDKDKIAEGRHERFVVADLQKFLERTMKKAG
jgi:fluoroacetyl-CoA thioesterase